MVCPRGLLKYCIFAIKMNFAYNLLVILGPTASGKTRLAVRVADGASGEIISADSRQIYRQMNLGTGKDLNEYFFNNRSIPYHLIDIAEPGYKYNVFEYQTDFFKAFNLVRKNNHLPILCGGTGLYIEAVLKHYRLIQVPVNELLREGLRSKSLKELSQILATFKQLHNQTDTDTIPRAIRAIEIETHYASHPPPPNALSTLHPLVVGINVERELRREKITARLRERLKEGMVEEGEALLKQGLSPDDLIYYGLEYKFLAHYLTGQLTRDQLFDQLNIAIHQFAKRQMTWFRGMERKGTPIQWIDSQMPDPEKQELILHWLLNK